MGTPPASAWRIRRPSDCSDDGAVCTASEKAAGLRYDLARTNALKVVCTALFSIASLSIFILAGRVEWVSGVILAVGMTAGAYLGVKLAVKVDQRLIKWMLFVMVCLTSASVLLFR